MPELGTEILDLIRLREEAHREITRKVAELQLVCEHPSLIQFDDDENASTVNMHNGWRLCLTCGVEEEPRPDRHGYGRYFYVLKSEDVTHVDMLNYALRQPFRGYKVQWRWCVGILGEQGHPLPATEAVYGMTEWLCREHKRQNDEYYRHQPQVVRMTAP